MFLDRTTVRIGLKGTLGGIFGALIGGIVLFSWLEFSGRSAAVSVLITAVLVVIGTGIGAAMREGET
jgi:hypothetical protein